MNASNASVLVIGGREAPSLPLPFLQRVFWDQTCKSSAHNAAKHRARYSPACALPPPDSAASEEMPVLTPVGFRSLAAASAELGEVGLRGEPVTTDPLGGALGPPNTPDGYSTAVEVVELALVARPASLFLATSSGDSSAKPTLGPGRYR